MLKEQIEFINKTPMNNLRFKHFKNLKSGFDLFSLMKSRKLYHSISTKNYEMLLLEFKKDFKSIEKAARWILRGLNCDKAIRTVKTSNIIVDEMLIADWKRKSKFNTTF